MYDQKMRIVVFYGGSRGSRPREDLLSWLRGPHVGAEARLVADDPAHSENAVDERVDRAIEWADGAIAILTRDKRGRFGAPNAVEEIGRWRGAHGKQTICIVLEDGVQLHSNLNGIVYLKFKRGIKECFEGIRRFLGALDKNSAHSVTGTWINLVSAGALRMRNGRPSSVRLQPILVGIVSISRFEQGFRYQGNNYDLKLCSKGQFISKIARLQWPRLEFTYENSSDSGPHFSLGLGTLTFTENGRRPPVHFHGQCFDFQFKLHTVEGWRIASSVVRQLSSPRARDKAISDLVKEYFPQIKVSAR